MSVSITRLSDDAEKNEDIDGIFGGDNDGNLEGNPLALSDGDVCGIEDNGWI